MALVGVVGGLSTAPIFSRRPRGRSSTARLALRTPQAVLRAAWRSSFRSARLMVLAGLKGWLYLLVGVWAYYHVIRQHYGFLVLYKVKNRDLGPIDNVLDRVFLGSHDDCPAVSPLLYPPPGRAWAFRSPFRALETALWIIVTAWQAVYLRANGSGWRAGDRSTSQIPAARGGGAAALADVRVPELAGRRPYGDHRTQPAVPRASSGSTIGTVIPREGPNRATAAFRRRSAAACSLMPAAGLPSAFCIVFPDSNWERFRTWLSVFSADSA